MPQTREEFHEAREREARADLARVAHQGDGEHQRYWLEGEVTRIEALHQDPKEKRPGWIEHDLIFWGGLTIIVSAFLAYYIVWALIEAEFWTLPARLALAATYVCANAVAIYRLIWAAA